MIVTIHQPDYLPWLGFFDRIDNSDVFVILDDVQFSSRGFYNRNRIKTPEGWTWLTVPVLHSFGQKINETGINNNEPWKRRHWNSLNRYYSKSPFFDEYAGFFESTYNSNWGFLCDLNIHIIKYLIRNLGIERDVVVSSSLGIKAKGSDLLIEICKRMGADVYLSGTGARDYMEDAKFRDASIKVVYQDFRHPVYPQRFGAFEPCMSIIDLLFNCGRDSIEIIRSGSKP